MAPQFGDITKRLTPRREWPLARKLAWFAAYVAVCYWSWFLIIPHR